MRTISKLICTVLVLALALMLALPSMAANEPYTYTVRVYPGNAGQASSGEHLEMTGIAAGTRVTIGMPDNESLSFGGGTISLQEGSKYFIRGVKVSGQDELAALSFKVDKDMDFVAAYGMKGTEVTYTVNFVVQATGQVLGSATYYGVVGDKPVTAAQFFDGYRPLAMNITGTLTEGENIFNLPYEVVEPETETVPAEGEEGGTTPGGEEGEEGGTTPGGEEGEEGETTPEGEESEEGTTPGGEEGEEGGTTPGGEEGEEGETEPEEIIDIDDENVPLGPGGDGNGSWWDQISDGTKIGVGIGGAALLALIIGLIAARRKKKKENS